MKKRLLLPVTFALAAACAVFAARSAPDAEAVAAAQVVGVYKIKLKGDGWWRATTTPYGVERVNGNALLVLARNTPDDGKLKVVIQLDAGLSGGLVDVATPTPDFAGTGTLVGDSMTVIGNGTATYVNAVTFTFLKGGARILGHWVSAFPPSDAAPDSSAAGAFGVDFTGRKLTKREGPIALSGAAGR